MTPKEIIARSIALHPALFADAMSERSAANRRYAAGCDKPEVAAIAYRMAGQEAYVADLIRAGDVETIMSELALWVPALNTAGRLQCLPQSALKAAVENA